MVKEKGQETIFGNLNIKIIKNRSIIWKYGEYIRTESGIIAKVLSELYEYKDGYKRDYDNDILNDWYNDEVIVKHSKNIFDLIEENDFINGNKVHSIDLKINSITKEKYIVINDIYTSRKTFYEWQIKDILTHEQYEQNSYKIGE